LLALVEVYFVSGLGSDVVAGASLVLPVQMLVVTMASSGIGGGVAVAVARALGAGRRDTAELLAAHAVALGIAIGLCITALQLIFGHQFFGWLAGSAASALAPTLVYADTLFAGAALIWVSSMLAAALRASGDARRPASVSMKAALFVLVVSPALINGWGPLPRLGIAGAAVGTLLYYALISIGLLRHMCFQQTSLRLRLPDKWDAKNFRLILHVGGWSVLGTMQSNLTALVVTGVVAGFGVNVLGGYGIASRVDYVVSPLVFSLGTAVLTVVATNLGAGKPWRAARAAWIGVAWSGLFTAMIGLVLSFNASAWMALFTSDSAVITEGANFLKAVGPVYGFFGIALATYFSGQGGGQVKWPVLAGTLRFIVAAVCSWLAVRGFSASAADVFYLVAGAHVFAGIACVVYMCIVFRSGLRSNILSPSTSDSL